MDDDEIIIEGSNQLQPTVSDYASIERKKWVMEQYLMGRQPFDIRNEYMKSYGLSRHAFDKDVTWMNQELRRIGENDVEELTQRHIERYNYIYNQCVVKGDMRSAVLALQAIEKLLGITKDKEKVKAGTYIQNNNLNLPSMSVEELKNLLGRG